MQVTTVKILLTVIIYQSLHQGLGHQAAYVSAMYVFDHLNWSYVTDAEDRDHQVQLHTGDLRRGLDLVFERVI
jgi:hypothetical protein